jgi:hypothetical protein
VHSGGSRPRNVDAQLFMLVWDQHGFHKKHVGTRYAEVVFLDPMGSVGHVVDSGVSKLQSVDALFVMLGGGGGPVGIPQKVQQDTLR